MPPALLWGLGVAVGLLILFVGASVLLRREVDRQTRQLATQNERLSETEALYRTLFDESPDGVAILDPETLRPIAFNHAAHTMYGYTRDEFAGIDVSDLEAIPMPDIDREMIAQLRSCGRYESELTQRTKAGDRISVQATLQVIRPAEKPVIHAIFRDVTAKKRAEETNRADRLRLATLAELGQIKATSLTVPEICELVMNRSIEITNSEYGYLFLYDEETQILTNYAWSKGVLPICTTEERQLIYPLAKTGLWGEAIRQRRPIVTNDYAAPNPLKKGYPEGHAHLVRHMNLPVFDGDRIVAVVGVANKPEPYDDDDVRQLQLLMQGAWQIVQRTRGEEALRQSEERFRAIFEQAAVGIAQNDTSGRYLQVNQRYCDIVGYTREELLQHTLLQITHPDDLAITSARFVEMLTGKIDTYTVEKRSIRGDGSSVWVSVTTSLIRGVAGAPPYVMGVVQDISERKAAEAERERLLVEQVDARRRIEELAETARRRAAELQSVLDSAVEGVVVADAAGRVTLVNGAASRILGVLAGELVGRTISDLPARLRIRHPDGRPVSTDELVLAAAIAGETFVGREQIVWNSTTGRDVNVHLSAAPVRSTEGAITGAVVAIHDVTALTELDRLKDQFISVAAHELKTPVTIMKGYAQTLQKSGESLPAGQRRMLDAIVRGANRIDRIIIELLDASRLSLGGLNLNVEKVDISALVAEAVEQADVTTPRHRVRLVGAESATVLADAARIEQVIVNLLDNAVRYSPQDHEVEVRVSVPNGEAVVSVADHGVGIPADKQDRIFERFYRAHTGTPYDYGGMGVSLYVSREIVQRHGGRIWFESEEGKGSTFYFSLPLASEQPPSLA